MEQKQVKSNKKRKVTIAVCSSLGAVAAVGLGLGVAYAIFYDKEAHREHTIVVDTTTAMHGYKITPSVDKAKKGDTVRFDVTKTASNESNVTYEPRAIRLTSTGHAGPSEYSLTPNGSGAYYAEVKILYASNMKVELVFNTLEDWIVTFDVDGGKTKIPKQSIPRGGKATKPIVDPEKDGHKFKYWYAQGSGGAEFDFTKAITGNVTLKAKWEVNKHTVTWKNWDGEVLQSTSEDYGTTPTYTKTTPTRTDDAQFSYVFAGWDNPIVAVTGDVTYTATFTPKVRSYIITFDNNGHGFKPADVNANYGDKISKPDVYDDGYNLVGWYTDTGLSAEWIFNTSTVSGATTLHAKWEVKKHNVSFDLAGGTSTTIVPKVVDHGETLTKPVDPTKEHFTFAGWTVEGKNDWVFQGETGTPTPVTKDVTFVANWTSVNYCVVTFNYQDGSLVETQSIVKGEKTAPATPIPTRTGYKFDGWWTTPSVGGEQITDWTTHTVSGNETFYARWTAEKYNVSFHDGTTTTIVPTTFNTKVARPANPTAASGKKFVGWMTTSGGSIEFDFDTPITKAIDLYAKFVDCDVISLAVTTYPKLEYTTGDTFDKTGMVVTATLADGSTTEWDASSTKYTIDSSAFKSNVPGTYPINISHTTGGVVPKTVTTTFYVKVKQQTITVTFDTNYVAGGPTYQTTIDKGSTVTRPLDPARANFKFDGWYEEAACTTEFDFAKPITADKTLYAKWDYVGPIIISEPSNPNDRIAYSDQTATSSWTWSFGDKVKYTYKFPGLFKLDVPTNGITPANLKASAKLSYKQLEFIMDGVIEEGVSSGTFNVSLTKTFSYSSSTDEMFRLESGSKLTVSDFVIQTKDGSQTYQCKNEYSCYTKPKIMLPTTDTTYDLIHAGGEWSQRIWIPLINGLNANPTDANFFRASSPAWSFKRFEYKVKDESEGEYFEIYAIFNDTPEISGQYLEFGFDVTFNNDSTTYFKKEVGTSPKLQLWTDPS